jgi:GT2 family glycosyltransferase
MLTQRSPLVSVVVITYNGSQVLKRCLASLFKSEISDCELILIDNASSDDSLQIAESVSQEHNHMDLKIVKNRLNYGPAGAELIAVQEARGEFIAILNDDVEVEPRWLQNMLDVVTRDKTIGMAQFHLLEPNRYQTSRGGMGIMVNAYGFEAPQNHDTASPGSIFYAIAAMLARKKAVIDSGNFDGSYFINYEDADICWRMLLAGYRVVCVPNAIVWHSTRSNWSWVKHSANSIYFQERNRIQTLIKNYSLSSLARFLPLTVLIILLQIPYFMFRRSPHLCFPIVRALAYNVFHLRHIWRKRVWVQTGIRRVPDSRILEAMRPVSFAFMFKNIKQMGRPKKGSC